MARVTIVFGVLLAAVAIAGRVTIGAGLHALWFGLVLVACGVLAMTDDARRRMIAMHVAVSVGLLGFVIPGTMSAVSLAKAHAGEPGLTRPALVQEQLIVAAICLLFVVLCVRSFIAARRARVA